MKFFCSCAGLLAGSLDGCVFWEKRRDSDTSYSAHSLDTLPAGRYPYHSKSTENYYAFYLFHTTASCTHTNTGACVCVSFEPYTRHCLSSFRPSRRCPNSRHTVSNCQTATIMSAPLNLSFLSLILQLFQLQSSASEPPLSSQLIDQFQGGPTFRLLSRSKLFQRPGAEDKILAAFGDEATKSVSLL